MSVNNINNSPNFGMLKVKDAKNWTKASQETLDALLVSNIAKKAEKDNFKASHHSYVLNDADFTNNIDLVILRKGKEAFAIMGQNTQNPQLAKQRLINKLRSLKDWSEALISGKLQKIDTSDIPGILKAVKSSQS